jgi:Resolvase, N terminal domain
MPAPRQSAEKISTRALTRPGLDKAVALAREMRASGVAVTIVVHEHKRLGRGIELAALAEQLRADAIGLEFLTGELQGSRDPSGVVFPVHAWPSRSGACGLRHLVEASAQMSRRLRPRHNCSSMQKA